jgi:hypothetical protein
MIILIHMILLNHENHFNHMKITVQTDERGAAAVRWPERPYLHNRRSTTCGEKTVPQLLPERQYLYGEILPFRQQNTVHPYPQAALSLTCGYENYVPSGPAIGDRTPSVQPCRDAINRVSTTAGTATAASRPNCDFRMIILIHMILLNHENHFNHMKITVRTIIKIISIIFQSQFRQRNYKL